MKKLILLTILVLIMQALNAQELLLNFNPVNTASTIDSIWVTNKETGASVLIKETNSFDLNGVFTGIGITKTNEKPIQIYPNPFPGEAELQFFSANEEDVEVLLSNLSGQLLAVYKQHVNPGSHKFSLSVSTAGLYTISVLSENGIASSNIVNTNAGINRNQIKYNGSVDNIFQEKSAAVEGGDLYHFKIYSGNNITLIADRPAESKTYDVGFWECIDDSGKIYPVTQIGGQLWMTENLSLNTSEGSWAYENDESYVPEYGRLYNYETAIKACPDGWYLPTKNDWEQLFEYVSNTYGPYEYHYGEWRDLAVHLKSTNGWDYLFPSDEWNLNGTDDFAFSALPGGKYYVGSSFSSFGNLNTYGFWWTSTEDSYYYALIKDLNSWDQTVNELNLYGKDHGNSVRCIRYPDKTTPVLSTNDVIDTDTSTAIIRSVLLSEGRSEVTEKGVCYNLSGNPTTEDSRTINTAAGSYDFVDTIKGLTPDQTYFVRSYAISNTGTSYGEEKEIRTKSSSLETGQLLDERDSKTYRWVKIGTQTWMAENLDFESEGSSPVFDEEFTLASGGRYYTWEDALSACPEGWRLPAESDWEILANYISDTYGPYDKIKSEWEDVGFHLKSTWDWKENGNGSDDFGFSALPGRRGESAIWWSLDANVNKASSQNVVYGGNRLAAQQFQKNKKLTVRCVKEHYLLRPYLFTDTVTEIDSTSAISGGQVTYDGGTAVTSRGVCWDKEREPTTWDSVVVAGSGTGKFTCQIKNLEPASRYYLRAFAENSTGVSYGDEMVFYTPLAAIDSGQFVDYRDTTSYKWVEIGDQIWMAENLSYDTTGCWPDNDNTAYISEFGRLYNWETATGVCPEGWHLPTDKEWEQLAKYVSDVYGPYSSTGIERHKVGIHLKSVTGWGSHNGMDHFGFKGLPGGYYPLIGWENPTNGSWWSATEYTDSCWFWRLDNSDSFSRLNTGKEMYLSIRCIRDEME